MTLLKRLWDLVSAPATGSALPGMHEELSGVSKEDAAEVERWLDEKSVDIELGRLSGLTPRVAATIAIAGTSFTVMLALALTDAARWVKTVPVCAQVSFIVLVAGIASLLATAIILALGAIESVELNALPSGDKVFQDLRNHKTPDSKATADRTLAHYLRHMRESHKQHLDLRYRRQRNAGRALKVAVALLALLVLLNATMNVIIISK
jgi:hypothetical protein